MPFCDFIQNLSQAPSKCLSKWRKVDKWDYFTNPSQEFKNSFCLGFRWIPRKTGRQNWRGSIFLRFNLVKYQCVALPQPSYMSVAIKHAKELLSGQASSFTLLMGVEHMKMNKNVSDLVLKNIFNPRKSFVLQCLSSGSLQWHI